MVYYAFRGIYISVDIRDSRLGLHIPSGTVVELNGKTIKIEGLVGATAYKANPNLKATSYALFGVGYAPAQFIESIDHYTTPDNFGPREGEGNGNYLLCYLYLFEPGRFAENPLGSQCTRKAETLVIQFPYAEATFKDTFVYDPNTDTWSLLIESQKPDGGWSQFATYSLVHPARSAAH